jgi:biotin transporter BioY
MQTPRTAYVVYLLGLIPVGLFYEHMREATGGAWLFLSLGVLYAILLRIAGEALESQLRRRRQKRETAGPRSAA